MVIDGSQALAWRLDRHSLAPPAAADVREVLRGVLATRAWPALLADLVIGPGWQRRIPVRCNAAWKGPAGRLRQQSERLSGVERSRTGRPFYGGSMDQRRWGLVLIAVVLLGLFVTANLRPKPVGGTAVAMPVPGPPGPGDCLGEPVPPEAEEQYIATAGAGEIRYPALEIRTCTGPRYGEVVHLYPDRDEVTGVADTYWGWGEACYRHGRKYVGAPLADIDPNEMSWDVTLGLQTVPVGPDETQRASGQRWIACVAYSYSTAGTIDPFPSSLHNAVSTGDDGGLLGLCILGPAGDHRGGSCARPHNGQIIALGVSGRSQLTRDQVRQDCERQIIALVGRPVRSDEGLEVRVNVWDPATGTESAENLILPASGLDCLVETTGDRQLAGGLIGLGDRPIPWA